jgi:protein TonB
MKSTILKFNIFILSIMACTSTFAEDKSGGYKAGQPRPYYIPIYVPQPKYPRRALVRGKEGYAVVEVTVTTTGAVRDPVLVEEFPEGWRFGRAALKAAKKLKYNPRVIDGQAQESSGVLYKFTFNLR